MRIPIKVLEQYFQFMPCVIVSVQWKTKLLF